MDSFYSPDELRALHLKSCGSRVKISRKTSIYGAENISIGNNVRIDDFCILTGKIDLGSNIHIAAYSALFGGTAGITVCDFANISARVCIYAVSDDFSGRSMTNPTIPEAYKQVTNAPVFIGKHVIVGTGSTVLPGVTLGEGAALGAMTLMRHSAKPWTIYVGVPAVELKPREKGLLELEEKYQREVSK